MRAHKARGEVGVRASPNRDKSAALRSLITRARGAHRERRWAGGGWRETRADPARRPPPSASGDGRAEPALGRCATRSCAEQRPARRNRARRRPAAASGGREAPRRAASMAEAEARRRAQVPAQVPEVAAVAAGRPQPTSRPWQARLPPDRAPRGGVGAPVGRRLQASSALAAAMAVAPRGQTAAPAAPCGWP